MTKEKSVGLAGVRSSSEQLNRGLPLFYDQLLLVLKVQSSLSQQPEKKEQMIEAAGNNDEPAMGYASGHLDEISLAKTAGEHGAELLRLGYTLSHVVHAYGAMCQSITELASEDDAPITADEFHDLNRCLDAATAGAVTQFQENHSIAEENREVEHLGFLAHELRNALSSATLSFQLIKAGSVGFQGSTGRVLERGLKRIGDLIDRSLTEVRLRVDPKIYPQRKPLLQIVDQILVTAQIEAQAREQSFSVEIGTEIEVFADQQLFYSALSNLIQNAMKYTHAGGHIIVRAKYAEDKVIIEIEDECGGLPASAINLFKPFEQQHEDRKGLGLGLTIAQRAITLNKGSIDLTDLPKRGCIFRITLPREVVTKH